MISTKRISGVWYAWMAWEDTPDRCDNGPIGNGKTRREAINNCKFLNNRSLKSKPCLPAPVFPRGTYWDFWREFKKNISGGVKM